MPWATLVSPLGLGVDDDGVGMVARRGGGGGLFSPFFVFRFWGGGWPLVCTLLYFCDLGREDVGVGMVAN